MNANVFVHTIQAVAQRTGLSLHVIRVWERRYGAVVPGRTESQRRLYSEEQIERLSLLRQLTQEGQGISYVAKLPTEQLRTLLANSPGSAAPVSPALPPVSAGPAAVSDAAWLERCLQAVRAFDASALESCLVDAEVALGSQGLLRRVAAPLVVESGHLWRLGEITAAHEHFCSAALRTFLSRRWGSGLPVQAPLLLVTTPAGQVHELGALLAASCAANLGWRILYLGPNLPAPEIAAAARQNRVTALALSLVYPEDDAALPGELRELRRLLPPELPVLIGGRAASAYAEACEAIGAWVSEDFDGFARTLDEVRRQGRG